MWVAGDFKPELGARIRPQLIRRKSWSAIPDGFDPLGGNGKAATTENLPKPKPPIKPSLRMVMSACPSRTSTRPKYSNTSMSEFDRPPFDFHNSRSRASIASSNSLPSEGDTLAPLGQMTENRRTEPVLEEKSNADDEQGGSRASGDDVQLITQTLPEGDIRQA